MTTTVGAALKRKRGACWECGEPLFAKGFACTACGSIGHLGPEDFVPRSSRDDTSDYVRAGYVGLGMLAWKGFLPAQPDPSSGDRSPSETAARLAAAEASARSLQISRALNSPDGRRAVVSVQDWFANGENFDLRTLLEEVLDGDPSFDIPGWLVYFNSNRLWREEMLTQAGFARRQS